MTELSICCDAIQDCKAEILELEDHFQDIKTQCLEKWGYIPDGEQSEILGICLQIEHLRNDIKFYENRISELEGLYA